MYCSICGRFGAMPFKVQLDGRPLCWYCYCQNPKAPTLLAPYQNTELTVAAGSDIWNTEGE